MRHRNGNKYAMHRLMIDQDFLHLHLSIPPEKMQQLEKNILRQKNPRPVIVWNGYIADGHKRYDIYDRNNIPFEICELEMANRYDVMDWICSRNLLRKDLSDGYKKYFIGRRYSLKVSSSAVKVSCSKPLHNRYLLAGQLATRYCLSQTTVMKYAQYAEALDVIYSLEPDIYSKLISDQVRVSIENVIAIARLSANDLRLLKKCFNDSNNDHLVISEIWRELQRSHGQPNPPKKPEPQKTPEIKNMPKYDPDAELMSLKLTIPMWKSSMERVNRTADFDNSSPKARSDLLCQLRSLTDTIQLLSIHIEEVDHGERNRSESGDVCSTGTLRTDPDKESGIKPGIST